MNKRKCCIRFSVLLTLLVCSLSLAQGQQRNQPAEPQSVGYAFVSPNTLENLTLKQAIAGLNSPEEANLIAEAHHVGCRFGKTVNVQKAVGSWSDGAEYSTIIRTRSAKSSLRYAASWLGKFARQKAILYFQQDRRGAGHMYVLNLPERSIAVVVGDLEANGIANRTLVPQRDKLVIYIVDLKNELKVKVAAMAHRLRVRFSTLTGEGEFIGDDDREKAQKVFEREISTYEATHRVRTDCSRAQ